MPFARFRSALWRKSGLGRLYRWVMPPNYPGLRLTWKRFLNYQHSRFEQWRGHTKLRAHPLTLTFEATNVCNLHCPYCFTGVGEVGRTRSMMAMDHYERLLDELGDRALMLDFYNWGEPLLNKKIYEMIEMASSRGISTVISTNFSVPFDEERADKLVASRLAALGLSIDGASQETLEVYRVGASLETILENLRLLVDAKRRAGSELPHITWAFHVFDHNQHEVEQARAMARDLGVTFTATKGWVEGDEWDKAAAYAFPSWTEPTSRRCKYLWSYAVVNNDGRVAPCAATFYESDDFGDAQGADFRAVWNNERFQQARSLFRSRDQASAEAKESICYECPYTVVWDDYQVHRQKGLPKSAFRERYNTNDWFNYFFEKRPGAQAPRVGSEVIGLEPVTAPRDA
jgi:radical SAM protein with 4Fe4S-binding SPASM domain